MFITVQIDTSELDTLGTQLARNANFEPIKNELADVFDRANREQIESSGRRAGTPYQRLSRFTVAQRLKQGYPAGPPLIKTGLLKEEMSLGLPLVSDGGRAIEIDYRSAVGLKHQLGNDDEHLPVREVFHPIDDDYDRATEIFADRYFRGL